MRVVGATGQIASTPDSGSRMIPLANEEAARLGLPGRTTIVGRRSDRPSMNPLRLMSFTSSSPIAFCVPYDDCGVTRRVVRHRIGQAAAEHGERAREHEFRRRIAGARAFEEISRRIEVHAHADVEVGFGLAADDGRQVKYRVGIRRDDRVDERAIIQRALDRPHAHVGVRRRRHDVDEHELAHRPRIAAGIGQRSSLENRVGEAAAEEAGATGDHDSHFRFPRNSGPPHPMSAASTRVDGQTPKSLQRLPGGDRDRMRQRFGMLVRERPLARLHHHAQHRLGP